MLYYDRTDISEGINVNKANKSKECNICHYRHFLNKGFKFQKDICNGSHDLLTISMDLSRIAILKIKGADYRCNHKMNAKYRFDRQKWNILKNKNSSSYIKKWLKKL